MTIEANSADLPLGVIIDASGNDPITPNSNWADGINNDADGSRVFSMFSYGYGSALDVTLENLTITGGDVSGFGGGIDYQNNSGGSLNLFDVKLMNNHALEGGGLSIRITGSQTAPVDVRIDRSEISGNTSGSSGGAGGIWLQSYGGNVEFFDSTILGNSATSTGGGMTAFTNSVEGFGGGFSFDHCIISNNTGGGQGGGISIASQAAADIDILNSTFSGNTSLTSSVMSGGGGLSANLTNGSLLIDHTTFDMNTTTKYGGGLFTKLYGGNLSILSSTITENHSQAQYCPVNGSE